MSRWSDSREVTRKSWAVIRHNTYLLSFPIAGFVLALVMMGIFWIPGIAFLAANQNIIGFALIVVGVFALATVTTLTTAGLVAAADEELAGRDASFGYGMGKALSRLAVLVQWAVIQSVVGLLIGLIRGNGEGNIVGVLLRNIVAASASVMWQLVTFFVLPFIMLEGAKPIGAIKQSAALFKQRWGTQLFGGVRIGGIVFLVAMLPALILVIGGVLLTANDMPAVGAPLLVVGLVVWAGAALVANAMRGIFSVALFRFAENGTAAFGFTEAELQSAVRTTR